jgi:hypothetical protein
MVSEQRAGLPPAPAPSPYRHLAKKNLGAPFRDFKGAARGSEKIFFFHERAWPKAPRPTRVSTVWHATKHHRGEANAMGSTTPSTVPLSLRRGLVLIGHGQGQFGECRPSGS